MRQKLMRIGLVLVCLLIVLLILSSLAVSKRPGCPPSKTDCDGKCINVKTDEKNCGYCGNSCDRGETCKNGKCVSRSCRKNCDDGDACTKDSCIRGRCVNDPIVCDATTTCCEGNCCPPEGVSIAAPPMHGKLEENPDGASFTYIPDPGYCGWDAYTIQGTDGCCNMYDEYFDILVECDGRVSVKQQQMPLA